MYITPAAVRSQKLSESTSHLTLLRHIPQEQNKPQIDQDAVRLMKELYGIDVEQMQYSKTITDIPKPDIAISMGCNVGCPFIGRAFDDNWELDDPTGKSDEEFISIIKRIEENILKLKDMYV